MNATRGRPVTGVRIDIRIPVDVLAALDAKAAEQGITRPDLIRQILKEAVTR